jgi:polysaccharide biosynthesis transport protein
LPNRSGLSNVIAEGLHPQRVIHQVSNNLDVLTAGLLPPNPLVLLDSRRMATLLEHFGNTYDYILIDTPPVTVAADALVTGKIADGILMVVRPGVVETHTVKTARDLLENSGQNLLGAVVNGLPVEKPAYYSGYYGGKVDTDFKNGDPDAVLDLDDYSGLLDELPKPANGKLNGHTSLNAGLEEPARK